MRATDTAGRRGLCVALMLALVPAPVRAAPVPGDRSAEAVPGDRSGEARAGCTAAQAAIASDSPGKYAEAARHFEACARSSGDAGLWKKAGMARYSGRQFAHAIVALHTYLQAQPGDAQVEPMLADARKNAGTVRFSVVVGPGGPVVERLRVGPRGGAPGDEIELPWSRSAVSSDVWLDPGPWVAELVLAGGGRVGPQDVHVAAESETPQVVLFRVEAAAVTGPTVAVAVAVASPVEVELVVGPAAALRRGVALRWSGPGVAPEERLRTASTRRMLAPGAWELELVAPRFAARGAALELRAGEPQKLAVELVRTREDRARIGQAAASGGVGLGLVVGGLAVALGGRKDYQAAAGQIDAAQGATRVQLTSDALAATARNSTGTMLGLGGLGAGIAAVTVGAGGNEKVLAIEAGLGAVLLVVGVAWLIPAKRNYSADSPATADRAFLDDHRRPELGAASLLGLGTGLAAGAALALVTRAMLRRGKSRATSLTPITAPRAIGLAFQGKF